MTNNEILANLLVLKVVSEFKKDTPLNDIIKKVKLELDLSDNYRKEFVRKWNE